jgi:hypothetical protein
MASPSSSRATCTMNSKDSTLHSSLITRSSTFMRHEAKEAAEYYGKSFNDNVTLKETKELALSTSMQVMEEKVSIKQVRVYVCARVENAEFQIRESFVRIGDDDELKFLCNSATVELGDSKTFVL